MEVLFQYLVPLLFFPLSFAAVLLLQKWGSQSPILNRPPGTSGWLIVGEGIHYALEGTEHFMKDRMKKYSPKVFQTSLLGEKMAVFCGEQGHKYLFTKGAKHLTTWQPRFIRKIMMFPENFESYNHMISTKVRDATIDVLKPEALKKFMAVMDSRAQKHIGRDRDRFPDEQVKFLPLSKKYAFDLACKLFLGIEDPARVSILADSFIAMTRGMHSVPLDFPGTAYRRSIEAGVRFRAELLRIIRERREELKESKETGDDVLSKMLLQNDISEMEMVRNMIALVAGSYETTPTAITFVLKHLAELPHIYDKVYQEVSAIAMGKAPDEELTWEDIQKMKYSWNVVRETMRVAPPSPGFLMEALSDFTFAGFTIPKGWKIFWSAYTTHKDPNYFPEPEKIDPTRFEGSGPMPYTFVPFGGGSRMCPGREYARVAVLVFIYNVVTRFSLEKADPNEKITYKPTPTPTKGMPLRLRPHAQ